MKAIRKTLCCLLTLSLLLQLSGCGLMGWGLMGGFDPGIDWDDPGEDPLVMEPGENAGGFTAPPVEEPPAQTQVQPVQPVDPIIPTTNTAQPYGDPDTTWTFMLYLCGTNLETQGGYASVNLREIMAADKSDRVNFLVETGGTYEWQTEGITNDELNYLHAEGGSLVVDERLPLASMGDPSTLSSFIRWGAEAYPADRYVLILWDHGGGSLYGACFDERFDDDQLTLPEMEKAVANAGVPLEIVGFDACLMASLEVAECFQGYAHYLVASEETEPGFGWDFTSFIEYASENPGCSGADLGKNMADSFYAKCEEYGNAQMATLSVVDLTRLPALSSSFRNLSGEMLLCANDADLLRAIAQGAAEAEAYGESAGSGGYDMVDLGDLVEHTKSVLKENAGSVDTAIGDAVVYEKHGSYRSGANGISVFYPIYTDPDILEDYAEISDNTAYLEYISVVDGSWDSYDWEQEWNNAWTEAYDYSPGDGAYDGYFGYSDDYYDDGYWEDYGEEYGDGYWEDYGEEYGDGYSGYYDYDDSYQEDYSGGWGGGSSYESSSSTPPWNNFFGGSRSQETLERFRSFKPDSAKNYEIKYTQDIDDDGNVNLHITSGAESVKAVSFTLVYQDDTDESVFIILGEDNDLYVDYKNGEFADNFRGYWLCIAGELIYAALLEANEDYNLYSIPVNLNGAETSLRAVYDNHTGKYSILGTYNGMDNDTGASGRDIQPLSDGDKLQFLCYGFVQGEEEDPVQAPLGSITWNAGTVMDETQLPDGNYLYMFEIADLFGNEILTDPIKMEIKNGTIYVSPF